MKQIQVLSSLIIVFWIGYARTLPTQVLDGTLALTMVTLA